MRCLVATDLPFRSMAMAVICVVWMRTPIATLECAANSLDLRFASTGGLLHLAFDDEPVGLHGAQILRDGWQAES